MKKGQRRLLLVLLSALMVFFVCGLTAYADDETVGLRTTGTFYISNDTANTVKVTGLRKSDGSDWFWLQHAGEQEEPYLTPSVITNIYTNDVIKFVGITPQYKVSASTDKDYKYCITFTDTKVYEGDVHFNLQHEHKWSLVKTGAKTAELECLNDGCEWHSDPVIITLDAEDARYDANGYNVERYLKASSDKDMPEGVVYLDDDAIVFRHLGKKVSNPTESGLYTASVTLALDSNVDEKVTLTDSFIIKRGINLKMGLIIDDWNVGDKPKKPDLDWTVAKNPLVFYTDEDSFTKIMTVISKLMQKDEPITIDDIKNLKGVKASLIPPTKEGSYLLFVMGVSKNYYDLGIDSVNVGERSFDAKVDGWTYGEYDPQKNAPKVTLDGKDVTEEAEFYYKPLFSYEDAAFYGFDPEKANYIDAGLYLMKVEYIDNSGDEAELMETYRLFEVSKAFIENVNLPVANELVAKGTPQELVKDPINDYGMFFYSVNQIGEPDDESILGSFAPPTGTDAGTYIVRYRFVPDANHYSGVVKGRIKVVIKPAEKPDSDIDPSSGDGDDQPDSGTTPPQSKADKLDGRMPYIAAKKPAVGKTSAVAKWKRLSKKNSKRCDGIEIMVATDKEFTKGCVTAMKGRRNASCKISGLARKTTYYVRVRTFREDQEARYVGKWSKVKKIRTR